MDAFIPVRSISSLFLNLMLTDFAKLIGFSMKVESIFNAKEHFCDDSILCVEKELVQINNTPPIAIVKEMSNTDAMSGEIHFGILKL